MISKLADPKALRTYRNCQAVVLFSTSCSFWLGVQPHFGVQPLTSTLQGLASLPPSLRHSWRRLLCRLLASLLDLARHWRDIIFISKWARKMSFCCLFGRWALGGLGCWLLESRCTWKFGIGLCLGLCLGN